MWRAKEKFCSTFVFEFWEPQIFSQNFNISVVYSIQFSIVIWEILKFLISNQNCGFYDVCSMELFSLWKDSSFRKYLPKCDLIMNRLLEDFWCHLIFAGRIWEEFLLYIDSHCDKIVRRMWVEMNILNVYFRANFSN